MYLLFEDAGKYLAGRVLSQTEASAQVELESGKRVKVKTAHGLLHFEKPAPEQLIAAAQALSADIELELAWEFAPEDEFGFAELAGVYFQDPPTLEQQAAALFRLFEAPHYFRRAGKGRFRKAAADVIAQALIAIEKKRLTQLQIEEWASSLAQGICPQPVREQLYKILFKPDKTAPEYKAVVEASRATQTAPLDLLQKVGAIDSPYQFHWQRFLFDNFPKGHKFPLSAQTFDIPANPSELPLAHVQAFSIDDSATTEIDDALSVIGLGSGTVTVGIHIAAPALVLQRGDPMDQVGASRLSTVYMPGFKITMLPDSVVQRFTLQEGRDCLAVSLYLAFDEVTLAVIATETRLERVPIANNLRHDQLDSLVTPDWLTGQAATESLQDIGLNPITGLRSQLSFLYRLALHLKSQREVVRGKPETFNRPDYNFKLINTQGLEPTGQEQVQISTRARGAPLDLMVAEAMILANSTWGQWLTEHGVPAIYRSQASLAPGIKVRMGTKALPHAGIGVKSYAWSTSPLRRYTDLVNQWQIIACARHGKTAALAAPFKPKDVDLFSIITRFEASYSAYNGYQGTMERYWTFKFIEQQGITELEATLFKENMVRADTLPLVLAVQGAKDLPRGARVRIRLGAIDEVSLDIQGTVIERLDAVNQPLPQGMEDEDEEPMGAGPIEIALELNEPVAPAGDNSQP